MYKYIYNFRHKYSGKQASNVQILGRIFLMCLFSLVCSRSHDYPPLLVSIVYCSIGKTTNKKTHTLRDILTFFSSVKLKKLNSFIYVFQEWEIWLFSGFNKTICVLFLSLQSFSQNCKRQFKFQKWIWNPSKYQFGVQG